MQAQLVLGPGVVNYVVSRGRVLTLRQSPRHGCCGGSASLLVAEARAPDDHAGYANWSQDGLTVFIEKALLAQLPLTVRLEGLFGLKRLFVEGAVVSAGS